jgi:hypothetical protein
MLMQRVVTTLGLCKRALCGVECMSDSCWILIGVISIGWTLSNVEKMKNTCNFLGGNYHVNI